MHGEYDFSPDTSYDGYCSGGGRGAGIAGAGVGPQGVWLVVGNSTVPLEMTSGLDWFWEIAVNEKSHHENEYLLVLCIQTKMFL